MKLHERNIADPPIVAVELDEKADGSVELNNTFVTQSVPSDSVQSVSLTPKSVSGCLVAISEDDPTPIKLLKLREIAADSDYTGMLPTEVNKAIRLRYDDAFGGMFSVIIRFQLSEEWRAITQQFFDELEKLSSVFGSEIFNISAYLEEKECSYEGMSYEEIEAFITKKYEGRNTLLDFLTITNELRRSGALTNRLGRTGALLYIDDIRRALAIQFGDGNVIPDEVLNRILHEQI